MATVQNQLPEQDLPTKVTGSPLRSQILALSRSGLLWPVAILFALFFTTPVVLVLYHVYSNDPYVLYGLSAVIAITGIICTTIIIHRVRKQLIKPLTRLQSWSLLQNRLATPPSTDDTETSDLAKDISHLGDELKILTEDMDNKVRVQTMHIASKSRSLEILYEIATSLSTAHSLDELLDQFLDTLMILVDAKAASVRLLTDDGNTRLVASRGLSEHVKKQEQFVSTDRCLCGHIATQGGLGIQSGLKDCEQFLDCAMVEGYCSELVVVPLQYQDNILGVYNLFLERPSKELGKDARDLLNSIGKHLGLALEKSKLDDNARRLAIMEERNMIGNELHDSLAQSLVSMRLQIKMLGELLHKKDHRSAQNEVRQLRSAIEEAHSSLRELLANFRTRIDHRGLFPAIEDLLLRLKEETGISTFLQNECSYSEYPLSPAQEIQIFHIVQEALTNVRKHSNACTVRVLINGSEDHCTVLIEDDGLGISDNLQSDHPGEHIGLSVMRQRASRLPGVINIESEAGEGTRIILVFSPNGSEDIASIMQQQTEQAS